MLTLTKSYFHDGLIIKTRPIKNIKRTKFGLYIIELNKDYTLGSRLTLFNYHKLSIDTFAPLDYFGTEEGRKAYLFYQLMYCMHYENYYGMRNSINSRLEGVFDAIDKAGISDEDYDYRMNYDFFLKFILEDGFVTFGLDSSFEQDGLSAHCTGEIKKGEYFFITPYMWNDNLKDPLRQYEETPIKKVIESGAEEFAFADLSCIKTVKNSDMRLGAKEVVPYVEFPYLQGVACLQEVLRHGEEVFGPEGNVEKLDLPYVKGFMAIDTGEFADEWKFETVYDENWDYEKRKSAGLELSKSKDFEKILIDYEFNNRSPNGAKKPELRLKTISEKWYYNPLKWEEENTD